VKERCGLAAAPALLARIAKVATMDWIPMPGPRPKTDFSHGAGLQPRVQLSHECQKVDAKSSQPSTKLYDVQSPSSELNLAHSPLTTTEPSREIGLRQGCRLPGALQHRQKDLVLTATGYSESESLHRRYASRQALVRRVGAQVGRETIVGGL
jgi:hypothetical protein